MEKIPLSKRLVSEFLGSFFLLAIVVGSGIMGERLSEGNLAVALLANSIATGLGLVVLITIFAGISGAHFNPLVTAVEGFEKRISPRDALLFMVLQLFGALAGVLAAHVMFGESYISISSHERSGFSQLFSEFIATFGLIIVIRLAVQDRVDKVPVLVGAYIASAYWFTASTSFANPVVTVARAMTASFAGIEPGSVTGFIAAQVAGALAAESIFRMYFKVRESK